MNWERAGAIYEKRRGAVAAIQRRHSLESMGSPTAASALASAATLRRRSEPRFCGTRLGRSTGSNWPGGRGGVGWGRMKTGSTRKVTTEARLPCSRSGGLRVGEHIGCGRCRRAGRIDGAGAGRVGGACSAPSGRGRMMGPESWGGAPGWYMVALSGRGHARGEVAGWYRHLFGFGPTFRLTLFASRASVGLGSV